MKSSPALNLRFAALQASFFAAYAGTSFLSVILLQKQVPTAYVGLMGALMSLSSSLVQPLWGILCDRYGCHRIFYCISGAAMPLIYLWIYHSSAPAALLLCALLSGMFINCMQNMGNGWIAGLDAEGISINYGASRSAGSFSYAVAAVIFGAVITRFGVHGLIGGMALCSVTCGALSFTVPRCGSHRRGQQAVSLSEGLRVLLAQREYVVIIVCGFLAMFGTAGLSSYYPVHLSNMGATATVVGLGTFAYAMAEVPFMLFFSPLSRRFSLRVLLTTSLLAISLQCILVGLSTTCLFAILAMSMQGMGFGLLVPCIQRYTAQNIDARYTSTAQLFSSAVCLSASMIFGNLAASALNRRFDLRTTFLLLSVLPLLSLGIFLFFRAGRSARQPVS